MSESREQVAAREWRKAHEMNGEQSDSWWDIWGNAEAFDKDLAALLARALAACALEEHTVMCLRLGNGAYPNCHWLDDLKSRRVTLLRCERGAMLERAAGEKS